MDKEEVIEFLGRVPLLQRLPSSSLRRVAEAVELKTYDRGQCVLRGGRKGSGVYFIWDGEAKVSGSLDTVEGGTEIVLKKFDYFGHGEIGLAAIGGCTQGPDAIAMTKLRCLVLPCERRFLLHPRSIWNAQGPLDSCPLVERILDLDPLEVSQSNVFRGMTLRGAPRFGRVFGGQLVGQALGAASKTVDCMKIANSLHSYFLLAGDPEAPIVYTVDRLRDGKSFATRRVDAAQEGNAVFTLIASFQKEEKGFEHQRAEVPPVLPPDELMSMDEMRERGVNPLLLPKEYRRKTGMEEFTPWPIDIKFCETTRSAAPTLSYWFKAKGKLSDDPALHRCVAAYASDLILLSVALNPHPEMGLKSSSASLDHSMWFHRPFLADEWLLFVITSPNAYNARAFCSAQMFRHSGELVATVAQEGVIRMARTPVGKL